MEYYYFRKKSGKRNIPKWKPRRKRIKWGNILCGIFIVLSVTFMMGIVIVATALQMAGYN
jgi:hypothetical protein